MVSEKKFYFSIYGTVELTLVWNSFLFEMKNKSMKQREKVKAHLTRALLFLKQQIIKIKLK